LTISGFVWEGNTEKLLKGTAYLIDEPTGAGTRRFICRRTVFPRNLSHRDTPVF
jgi:hypothetical protein